MDTLTQLGAIGFINTLPIYGAWTPQPHTRLVYDAPANLNRALLTGKLDISPISSAFYLENTERLVLLPGLSVSSYGGVSSVLVLSQVPLEAMTTIAIPDDSATSVALLKLYCQAVLGFMPSMPVYQANALTQTLGTTSSALVIGDRALLASANNLTPYQLDLSDWWVSYTGLPVVFAVWAANRQYYIEQPTHVDKIINSLQNARDSFFSDNAIQEKIVEKARQQCDLPASAITHYFTQSLNYDWTPQHQASLDQLNRAINT